MYFAQNILLLTKKSHYLKSIINGNLKAMFPCSHQFQPSEYFHNQLFYIKYPDTYTLSIFERFSSNVFLLINPVLIIALLFIITKSSVQCFINSSIKSVRMVRREINIIQ